MCQQIEIFIRIKPDSRNFITRFKKVENHRLKQVE